LITEERQPKEHAWSSAARGRLAAIARVLGLAPLALALACSSGAAKPDGGGTGGGAGAGSGGESGRGSGGGAGGAASLPSCAIGAQTPSAQDCSDFAVTGDWVTSDRAVAGDGGIYVPGGEYVTPMGGVIANGDYDLVKSVWGSTMQRTRRSMRVFDGGAFISWVVDVDDSATDAGVMHYRANTNATVANDVIQVTANDCGATISSYSYTVAGEQLLLFNFTADALFTFQQRCTR
jgi:hypothetical protein